MVTKKLNVKIKIKPETVAQLNSTKNEQDFDRREEVFAKFREELTSEIMYKLLCRVFFHQFNILVIHRRALEK